MLLAAVLLTAIIRPSRVPDAAVAVPAALIVVLTGALPLHQAGDAARRLLPVLGFLGAVLVLGHLCQQEGLFSAAAARLARASRGAPVRLLRGVFGLASVTTAVLSLDTTVVLLTPVVHDTAVRLKVRLKPPVYACTHLANSASLLLPVSNLTNLLAFTVAGLTLIRFGALMALPWLAAIAVEYVVFRRFFAADLDAGAGPAPGGAGPTSTGAPGGAGVPVFTFAVVGATLAGFVVTSAAGVNPAWAAFAGAAVLAVRALVQRRTTPAGLGRAADVPFLLFVLGLGIVVRAVTGNGLGEALRPLMPGDTTLLALLATAGLAAVVANLINNLPAVLVLAPLAAPGGAGAVLAVLLGVNIGPNLTYTGSLATLLWRRVLRQHGPGPSLREFTTLGLLSVPAALAAGVLALWAALHVLGG